MNLIYENDPSLSPELQQVGCYVESIAVYDPDVTDEKMNQVWFEAKAKGYVDKDLILLNPQGVVDLFGYPLKFRGVHSPGSEIVDSLTMHLVAEWHNTNTGYSHFVVMDGKGISRDNVKYDPIKGGSVTVRDGNFVSYRIFDKETV